MAKIEMTNPITGWFDGAHQFNWDEFHQGSADPVHKGVSIIWSFKNTSGKTIKYIGFNFGAYNAVGDCVGDATGRFTGPLSNNQIVRDKLFHNAFYDGTVKTAKLHLLSIEYMDGTKDESIYTKAGMNYYGFDPNSPRVIEEFKKRGWTFDEGQIVKMVSSLQSNQSNYTPSQTNASSSGGCYIATAVYGSYDCPQVWTLRRYRDYGLAKSISGRAFVKAYYLISPSLVKMFGRRKWFNEIGKKKLDKFVSKLQEKGYDNTPYQDKNW